MPGLPPGNETPEGAQGDGASRPAPRTQAEVLLELARVTRGFGPALEGGMIWDDGLILARIALALEFERRGKAFQLRAIMEEWDHMRIVKEMY